MSNMENDFYRVVQLDENTWLVYDKTKNVPTPHYYNTLQGASKKACSIALNAFGNLFY